MLSDVIAELERRLPSAFDASGDPPERPDPEDLDDRSGRTPVILIAGPQIESDLPGREYGTEPNVPLVHAAPGSDTDLDPQTQRHLDGRVATGGLDVLAWYRSFHYGTWRWGIFIRERGVLWMAKAIGDALGQPSGPHQATALHVLRGHETFHYLVDLAATAAELAVHAPLYLPRQHAKARSTPCYSEREEAMANENALRSTPSELRGAVGSVLAKGPAGYRDFADFRRRRSRIDGLRALAAELYSGGRDDTPLPLGELLFENLKANRHEAEVPVWLLRDAPAGRHLAFVASITQVLETSSFQKNLDRLRRSGKDFDKSWTKVKEQLAIGTNVPGLNFEKIGDGLFSVRIDRSYRAMLRLQPDGHWLAESIGTHDEVYGKARR